MLSTEAIELLMREVRLFLERAATDLAEGRAAPTLAVETRHELDVLTTVLDEAPIGTHEQVHYLIDRLEALMKRLAH